jgi:hypothetical protein
VAGHLQLQQDTRDSSEAEFDTWKFHGKEIYYHIYVRKCLSEN